MRMKESVVIFDVNIVILNTKFLDMTSCVDGRRLMARDEVLFNDDSSHI